MAKIPDYMQIRDDKFTLICYTRLDRPEKALEKCGLGDKIVQIRALCDTLPFGRMHKIEF